MKEIWKDIPDYSLHQASNLGRIRSLPRYVDHSTSGGMFLRNGKILTVTKGKAGYYRVGLTYLGVIFTESVHRLIAMAWLPNPHNKKTVNHKDGNKLNNNVNNLEWNTHKENVHHSISIGTKAQAKGTQFVNRTKFDEVQVRVIKSLKGSGLTQKQIGDYFGVHRITINDIFSGRSWSHIV